MSRKLGIMYLSVDTYKIVLELEWNKVQGHADSKELMIKNEDISPVREQGVAVVEDSASMCPSLVRNPTLDSIDSVRFNICSPVRIWCFNKESIAS